MYAQAHTDSGHLTASRFGHNFLSWAYREQDAPDKNNNRKNKECKVRQELYRKHQICKKAQQDVGLFYYQNLIRIIRIMLILNILSNYQI